MNNGHIEGLLQFTDERQDGQLREREHPLRPVRGNIIVPKHVIRQMRLRPGLLLGGTPRGRTLDRVETIEGMHPDEYGSRIHLYEGTALDPEPMIKLEHDPNEITTRAMDILTPVGFGQRGLIVAPPRTGKTILLQNIAKGIHGELSGCDPRAAADRRAAGRSHRHEAQRARARSTLPPTTTPSRSILTWRSS